MNLNKEYQQDALNLNVNMEGDDVTNHYSEIDKISPCESSWSTWPEDLRYTSAVQTYVNVSDSRSTSLFAVPTPPPPPPPPSLGPNVSPPKPKFNCELVQSMNGLSLNANSDHQEVAVVKKLDPVFLAELEKHLGEKEATKNTNASNGKHQQPETVSANYLHYSSLEKLRQNSISTQQLSTSEDAIRPLSIIPTLKPPPQGKPKSPVATIDRRANTSSIPPGKVQNSWQPKSTNVQKPRLQNDQGVSESATEVIVSQIWQQTQTLSQQPNVCLANSASNQILMPISVTQASVNRFQETSSNASDSGTSDQNQYGSCNVTKAATLLQTQACSSNQNYPQNTLQVNHDNINLLEGTSDNITSDNANETHGPCNIAKTTFNQTQACSSNSQRYLQNSLGIDQDIFNLRQVAVNNVSSNARNYSQCDAASIPKASQAQACSLTDGSQNYLHNTGFNLFQATANHVSDKSASEFSQYGHCNISKAASNQAQIYSSSSQSYTPNVTPIFHPSNFASPQICLQSAPMLFSTSNTYGITHIQNDLQQSQLLKPTTLLSEQVYAELRQTVCNFCNYWGAGK